MSDCMGRETVSAGVDAEMRRFIEEEADKRAITPAEFLRRLMDVYRRSTNGEVQCPACGVSADIGEAV